MKYIDAEKLKRFVGELKEWAKRNRCDSWGIVPDALEEVEGCIDSLQQEPRFSQYDNIVEKVFGAGNLEGWERDEAEILVALAKEELLKSLQQEQPEVDLKKEYKEYVEDDPVFSKLTNRNVGLAIARHFYELGLNARKK